MVNQLRNHIRKLKFEIGIDPIINTSKSFTQFIPESYHTVCLISADFELAWAWQYTKSANNAMVKALKMAMQERENLPKIVELCERFGISVTWATVGHLFLEKCTLQNSKPHHNLPRLSHFENQYWNFQGNDWFDNDPCSDFRTNPEWYCPDLIRMLLNSSIEHEIGNHTFSHIDCSNSICTPEVFRAEILESKKHAADFGIELKSFVHPGHTIGYLDILAEEGFTNFRSNYRNILAYPKKHRNGLWEFEQTMDFRYYKYWSIDFQIRRYITILKRAMKSKTICIFWFHPSLDPVVIEQILPKIFQFLNENRDKIWITTHTEYVNWLNGNE